MQRPRVKVGTGNIVAREIGVEVDAKLEAPAELMTEIAIEVARPFGRQRISLAGVAAERTRSRYLLEIALPKREVSEFKIEISDRTAECDMIVHRPAHIGLNTLGLCARWVADIEAELPIENIGLEVGIGRAIG